LKIGYRTAKTAVGAGLSIGIAQALDLQFYASAGILTILCIKKTQKRSLENAWERFLACLIGMLFAAVTFEILGYYPWSMTLLILALIPTIIYAKATQGVITSSVIILHIYTLHHVNISIILNELALIIIGVGVALVMNLYMPNKERDLLKYQSRIEENLKRILLEFARYLREGESSWSGKEITETAYLLKKAKALALQEIENHMFYEEDYYYRYFKMREKQFDVIRQIMRIVSGIDQPCEQGEAIAQFLEELSEGVHPGNTASKYLKALDELRERFKDTPLPQDRQEFENRAALLHFINELEQYLLIKRRFDPKVKSDNRTFSRRFSGQK
jgi:uncharacterized membrane protein YgaE (UPF0421/DUF939 family)